MSNLLKPNTILSVDGRKCAVEGLVGFGGAGQVYRASLDGKEVAVKWYYPWSATPALRAVLGNMVRAGPPGGAANGALFVWPQALVEWASRPEEASDPWAPKRVETAALGFGCVLPWRGKQFKSLGDLMAGRVELAFRASLNVALHWAEAFRLLHLKGFVFGDLSPGNLFVEPGGEGLLCDTDGVSTSGSAPHLGPGMLLAAPELLGEPPVLPSTDTDLHTLAVVLCCLLVRANPFEEPAAERAFNVNAAELRKIYRSPAFVFGPNKPPADAAAKRRWDNLPESLRDRLTQTLTTGAQNPAARVNVEEWIAALLATRDRLVTCPHDQSVSFAQSDAQETISATCRRCGKLLDIPLVLRFQRAGEIIVVSDEAKVYRRHLSQEGSPLKPVGTFARHPTQPNVFGLQNQTDQAWDYMRPDRSETKVEPGKRVTLAAGGILRFGPTLAKLTTASLPLDQLWGMRPTEATPAPEPAAEPSPFAPQSPGLLAEATAEPSSQPPTGSEGAEEDRRPATPSEVAAERP